MDAEHQHMLFAHAEAHAIGTETIQHQLPPETMTDVTSDHVRSCVVCFKDQPLSSFPDISHDSRHQHGANTCRTCFNRYLIQQVNAGNARARCVECQEPLRYADVKIIVSKTTLMKYDKNLLKAFVEEDVDFYYCVSNSNPARLIPLHFVFHISREHCLLNASTDVGQVQEWSNSHRRRRHAHLLLQSLQPQALYGLRDPLARGRNLRPVPGPPR